MKRHFFISNLVFLVFFLIQPAFLFSQTSGYKIIDSVKIGGQGGWDYLSILPSQHKLFVSHGAEVDVINLDDNSIAGKITGMKGTHGIAFAEEFNKGFISDGHDNSIVIFDLKNLNKIETVQSTGEDPDAIVYDPFTKRIFAFNGHDGTATAIDAKTNKVVGTIQLSGSPEFSVSDFNGKMYVNIEKKNEIDVFNPRTLKVENTWLIPPCETLCAMAIDRKNNRLFIGARNKTLGVVDASSGKLIAHFPIGSGVDACRFDPQTDLIFCSNKDGTMSVIKQDSPDKYSFVENIITRPKAKTMEIDETTHKIYTSTMLNLPGGKSEFGVLVLGRN